MPVTATTAYTSTYDPEQLIVIAQDDDRYTATWTQPDRQSRDCCDDGHGTRRDALTCAERQLRHPQEGGGVPGS
jgi:hypothetical protein